MGKVAFRAAMVFLVITLAVLLVPTGGNGAAVQGDEIGRARQALVSNDAARTCLVIVAAALLLEGNPAWGVGQMITSHLLERWAPGDARRDGANITWDNILWDNLRLDKIRLVNILWDVTAAGSVAYRAASPPVAGRFWTGRDGEVR